MIEIYSQTLEGVTFAVALDHGEVVTTTFRADKKTALTAVLDNLPFGVPFQVFHIPTALAKTALDVLKAIYDGKEPSATLPFATSRLSVYTQKVLKATSAIPIGYVSTYGAIAAAVGGGPRAVGNAMACNLFAPVVPCHRVVKSDFSLGGYGVGGFKVKFEFLNREKKGYTKPKSIAVCGGQLRVFPVEQVLAKCP